MIKLKGKARQQIDIKEVKEGILILSSNKYRTILETSAINYELKSEEEKDQITDNFQNFLNALPCPIQILIRTREIDIGGYLEDFKIYQSKETQDQLKEYEMFIKKLVSGNKILTRKFFIVIPYISKNKKVDFQLIKEQLSLDSDIISKSLERLGMKTRTLGTLEILNLFYEFYNPSHLKTQPLSSKTFQELSKNNYGI